MAAAPPDAAGPPLRVLNYAVNGLGLGHLTRLIAINRHVRRLAWVLGRPAEITFLTSSEGDGLCFEHGFPAFKIPSKTAAAAGQMDATRYRKVGKQWIWNAVNLLSPDIFVVDTFPAGAFHELYDVLDLGSRNAFIYRAVRPEEAERPAFRLALFGYDRIIVPLENGENVSPIPDACANRVAEVPPILLRSAAEVLPRDEARRRLGLADERPAVYASMGGGGDETAEAVFDAVVEAATALPRLQFVIGAGALYRGREASAPNVRWTRRPVMIECFRAFDAAITAGGFNSVWELMHVGVPCLFLPRGRAFDDQDARVERCVAAGAGQRLATLTTDAITDGLGQVLGLTPPGLSGVDHPACASDRSAAARSLVPANGALAAAVEIVSLAHAHDEVEDAALACDEEAIVRATAAGLDEATFLRAVGTLWRRAESWGPSVADDAFDASTRYLTTCATERIRTTRALRTLGRPKARATPHEAVDDALAKLRPDDALSPDLSLDLSLDYGGAT